MNTEPSRPLLDFRPSKDYFIGIDSDGCAFDTMEVKHKECFIPNIIRYFGLQAVSRYTREAAEFLNLYSRWRGVNRFPALLRTMDLLAEREEVRQRKFDVPRLPAVRKWLAAESHPGNPALEAVIAAGNSDCAELKLVLEWSMAVNRAVTDIVHDIPPFPAVRNSLEKAVKHADLMVVSATPSEALEREWAEHELSQYVSLIAGQEMGTKAEHLRIAAGNNYSSDRALMIGDAIGDLNAARDNQVLFYPIIPGAEARSWERFNQEALERFLSGNYAGRYQDSLIAEFETLLPDTAPWQNHQAKRM